MKSALKKLKELNEAIKDYPTVLPLIGPVLELEEKVRALEQTKEDKPGTESITVSPSDLSRGKLQTKMYQTLTEAGAKEQEVALKIYLCLSNLQ